MSNESNVRTRRRLLQTTGASLATVVAGCLGADETTDQQEPEPEPEPEPQTQQSQDQGRPDLPHETRDDNQLTTEYIPTHKEIVDDFTSYRAEAYSGARTTAGFRGWAEIKVDGDQILGTLERRTPDYDPSTEFKFYQEQPSSDILIEENNKSRGETNYHIINPNETQEDYLEIARQLTQRENHAELLLPTNIHENIDGLNHAIEQMPLIFEETRENKMNGELSHIYSWTGTDSNQYPGNRGLEPTEISDFNSLIGASDKTGHIQAWTVEYNKEEGSIPRSHQGFLLDEDYDLSRPSFADRALAADN